MKLTTARGKPCAVAAVLTGDVSGHIYSVENLVPSDFQPQIPDAVVSSGPVAATNCEYVPNTYEAILEAEQEGLITIRRYEG